MDRRCGRRSLWAFALLVPLRVAALDVEPPPRPERLYLPEGGTYAVAADGELSWLGFQLPKSWDPSGACTPSTLDLTGWNPATGLVRSRLFEPDISFSDWTAHAALQGGLMAWTVPSCEDAKRLERIVFLPTGARQPLVLDLPKGQPFAIRKPAELLALGPDTAALVARDEQRRVRVAVIRRRGSQLTVEDMPPLDGPIRGDYAAAVAGRDQVMILGGSDDQYRGCSNCRAETHLLDVKARAWRAGPPMAEGRSEASATALPDGSVLVSGGWTKQAGWGEGPSYTAERWNPITNRFEALPNMPEGNAQHRFQWWHAPWGDTLVSAQGFAGVAHAFDPVTLSWRSLGSWPSSNEKGGCCFIPFVLRGQAFAWQSMAGARSLSLLRPPPNAPAKPPPERMLLTYGIDSAFLPAAGNAPALWIGGRQPAGSGNYLPSSAVEAIDRDGRISAWPVLPTPRAGSEVVRLAGGVLSMMGRPPGRPKSGWESASESVPTSRSAQWLDSPAGTWREVGGEVPKSGDALTPLQDGSLMSVSPSGELSQLKLQMRDGRPWLVASPWPALTLPRRRGPGEGDDLGIQALADGRIVVAGGAVREERIALLKPDADKLDAPDEYVPIGPYLGSHRVEVFDPQTGRWAVSAPSETYSGSVLMLADGRVIKRGVVVTEAGSTESLTYRREIFDPRRMAWQAFEPAGSQLLEDYRYRLFTLEGEVFAVGQDAGKTRLGLEWLNWATQRWELIWHADDRGSDLWGRVIVRSLVGMGGQRKTLIIPVEGF